MLQVYIESGEETLDPVHPNISMHILIAVFYKFSEVLTQSRCSHNQGAHTIKVLNNQELLSLVIISIILMTLTLG